jgi:hypothetical protein
MSPGLFFDCYGYRFELTGNCASAIGGAADDFAFFASEPPAGPCVKLILDRDNPDYEGLPPVVARFYTPRNVVYQAGNVRILDFGGRGLARWDPMTRVFHMRSQDADLVYEAAYLFLLSQIGENLDARRMHRLHALAMSWNGRAVLAMLPMGGGKSTLGLEMLKHPGFQLLSDDSPIIGPHGEVKAFPLRLGLLPGQEQEVPASQRRLIQRMEFGPKYVVNYAHFSNRVAPSAQPGLLLIGRRTLAREGWVERASCRQAMRAMFSHMVLGLGLYQGLEYLVNHSAGELLAKLGVAASRARNAYALVRRSRNYFLYLGRDVAANARLVTALAEERLPQA